jgi:hypothetical protein
MAFAENKGDTRGHKRGLWGCKRGVKRPGEDGKGAL